MTYRIYTKTGDKGQTGLFGGGRVRKDDVRVEAYGAVDELNAALGVVTTDVSDSEIKGFLAKLQAELFTLGAELATPDPAKHRVQTLGEAEITWMENTIDKAEEELLPLTKFILPGGHPAAAKLHLARTIGRRAERRVLTFGASHELRDQVIVYLNRLSDLLFVLARLVNHRAGVTEPTWEANRKEAR